MKMVMKPAMPPTSQRVFSAFGCLLASGLLVLTGCPEDGEVLPDGGTPDSGGGGVTASFTSLYGDYLGNCKECHAPNAPGRTSDIEQTLDFTSRNTAFTTLTTGMATGLVGNHTGCNDVPFIASSPGSSLLVAVIDQPTRQAFDVSQHPNCDVDAITDATVKVGSQPSSAFVTALKTWISNGAMDN